MAHARKYGVQSLDDLRRVLLGKAHWRLELQHVAMHTVTMGNDVVINQEPGIRRRKQISLHPEGETATCSELDFKGC